MMKLSRRSIYASFACIAIMIGIGAFFTKSSSSTYVHDIQILKESSIYPEKDYVYSTRDKIEFLVDGELFVIPKYFKTDLASIPRWYWPILSPRYSSFVTPSIIHDYFYRCIEYKSRKFADEVLYDSLLSKGVSGYTASKFYWTVRIFGGQFYTTDQCKDAIKNEENRNTTRRMDNSLRRI